MSKTSQFKTACRDDSSYVAQLKQQKSKGDITYHTLLISNMCACQCADK